ncbi:fluoride efflux transporter FluC [Actinospica robiniae]|uniref:fluoride efflux transporter FluC n=1 Tax=Actinospica robiniae TaxID=304901 RepID=UPI001B7F80AD|nr:CrcB family protein [Actinospica robiniae]
MRRDDTDQVVDGEQTMPLDPDIDQLPDPFASSGTRGGNPPRPRILAAIAIGGFVGGLARYGLGLAFPAAHGTFPAATFAINVSGSFILALLIVLVLEVWSPTTYVRPLIGTGFCGAYTTFSTWMVGVDQLVSAHRPATAAWYLVGSLIAGLAATSLGLTCGRAVAAHRRRRAQTAAATEGASA